jgi:HlyD family secretion protein
MRRLALLLLLTVVAGFSALALQLSLPFLTSSVLSAMPTVGRADMARYRTATVERGDLITTVTAAGTLNAVVQVEVGSQVSGLVKELYADFNSKVTRGQVIARIDPESFEAKVAEAQAQLEIAEALVPVQRAQIERYRAEFETAQATHAAARAQTARAELAVDQAKRELDRKRALTESAVVSASTWEQTQNAHHSAQAQVKATLAEEQSKAAAARAAEATIRTAEAQLAYDTAQVMQKEAALRQAQIDLDHTYIRAPVTGTVVNRSVNTGQTVAASFYAPTLFTIAQDLTRMQVEAAIVEADIGRFAMGQPVTFTVDAYPGRTFSGEVREIRKASQAVQNVVTYPVVISAENPGETLLPGMTANLQVVVAKREGVLKVPNMALRFHPAGQTAEAAPMPTASADAAERSGNRVGVRGRVFVLDPDGRQRPVPLQLGITDERMTEVLAGALAEGQAVIIGAPLPGSAGAAQTAGSGGALVWRR